MKLRLGFSVAIHGQPDILLLDEIMGMGDEDFQKKSQVKIKEIIGSEATILMVSHQIDYLQKYSNRLIGLKNL